MQIIFACLRTGTGLATRPVKLPHHLIGRVTLVCMMLCGAGAAFQASASGIYPLGDTVDSSRLSDKPTKFLSKGDIPERPGMILELGDPFLGSGPLDPGFELPTGAVWQPRLWIFGTVRSAVQTIDRGPTQRTSEWVNRVDLFANLQLTGTEKIVLGIRPVDQNSSDEFSGYTIEPKEDRGLQGSFNGNIRTLFMEGDFGSLFPGIDSKGTAPIDFGFSVGRQPLIFQDGILINDTVDAVGLVRDNIRLPGVSNMRISAVYGWNELRRSAAGLPQSFEDGLTMYGLFTSWDMSRSTINLDAIYVEDDRATGTDSVYAGISSAQQIGHLNTTFRANTSVAINRETALVRDGVLLSAELSWTPARSDDTVYINPFVAVGEFLQAGREAIDGGGPLAPLGILFASPNIGQFGSELSNRANDVAGIALGYQAFWDDHRRNLTLEIAARTQIGNIGDKIGLDSPGDGFNQYGIGF
jgi:hypothetical protein